MFLASVCYLSVYISQEQTYEQLIDDSSMSHVRVFGNVFDRMSIAHLWRVLLLNCRSFLRIGIIFNYSSVVVVVVFFFNWTVKSFEKRVTWRTTINNHIGRYRYSIDGAFRISFDNIRNEKKEHYDSIMSHCWPDLADQETTQIHFKRKQTPGK